MGPLHALDEDPGHAGSFKCGYGKCEYKLSTCLRSANRAKCSRYLLYK